MASSDEFRSMQEEAIRRVREMQRRSQDFVGASSKRPQQGPDPLSRLLSSVGAGGGTDFLGIDEEKALIALLIYILYKQGADIKLLLALGYLLL